MPCITCCPETKCSTSSINVIMGSVFVLSSIFFLLALHDDGFENASLVHVLDKTKGLVSFIGLSITSVYGIYLACKHAGGCCANLRAIYDGRAIDDGDDVYRNLAGRYA